MAARTSPTFRRRKLGKRLRQLRENANMSLEAAAPLLDKTRSALARVEKGETRADVHLVRSMMDLYDQRDDTLLDLARDAAKKGWWRAYGVADFGYVDVETEAAAVREFAGLNIPGLLQTEDYVRALMRGGPRHSQREVENEVALRMRRQERLADDTNLLELTVIVDEAALLREVGGAAVMAAQLTRLVEASALPNVTLQVLPLRAGAHDGMNGGFIVLEFPEADDADLLYVSYPTGALHLEKAEEVRSARLVFDRLRSQALPPKDSIALIARGVERWSGT